MNKEKKMVLIISVCGLILILAVFTIMGVNGFNKDKESSKVSSGSTVQVRLDELAGTWQYQDGTKYRFDGMGQGGMTVGDYEYTYSYTISDNKLEIMYDNSEVHDSEYTFEFEDDKLKLIGGEGTAGGEYLLNNIG